MSRIEFPVWTVVRAALAMPLRYPLALLKFGLLPLLIATACLPPAINVGNTMTIKIQGQDVVLGPSGETFSTTDNELGFRDLIGFILMLPFAAAFAAAWNRLTATGDESSMGRPPIAFDTRTVSVIWAFIRLTAVALGVMLILFVVSLFFFGHYHDGILTYSYHFSVDGVGPTAALLAGVLGPLLALAWFMLRFVLVIPGAAMGEPLTLRESWRLTALVQFRLLASAVLLTIVFVILSLLLSAAMLPLFWIAGAEMTFYITVALTIPLLMYGHALWAGLLGATYGLLLAGVGTRRAAKVFD